MKKTKRIFTAFILISQMMFLCAGGETIEKITLNAGTVKVEGFSDEAAVSYKIYGEGSTGDNMEDICEIGEAAVSDGRFSFTFNMPEYIGGQKVDGTFKIDVKGEETASDSFVFTAESYRKALLEAMNGKSSPEEIIQLIEEKTSDGVYDNLTVLNNLGFNAGYWSSLSEKGKSDFSKAFLAGKGSDVLTEENFMSLYSKARTVQYLNENKADRSWLDESEFEFEKTVYRDIENEDLKKWIEDVFGDKNTYQSYSDIEKKYREANVMYLINNAKFTEYDKLIQKYDDVTAIGEETYYKEYLNLDSSKKSKINSKLKNALNKSPIKSAEDFRKKYSEIIAEVSSEKDSGGSGTGGGSGGGGNGGGVSVSAGSGLSVILPEISDPTKDKPQFDDLDEAEWAREAVISLVNRGVVSGYDDGSFKPLKNITREEFIKMAVSVLGIELNAESSGFLDVDENAWYAPYVNAAYAKGIINGISETWFGIGSEIKREDMAVIISRLKKYEGAEKAPFADDADIAEYARSAVYSLYGAGKISGMGNNMFGPKFIVNRAQAAKIIYDTLIA